MLEYDEKLLHEISGFLAGAHKEDLTIAEAKISKLLIDNAYMYRDDNGVLQATPMDDMNSN